MMYHQAHKLFDAIRIPIEKIQHMSGTGDHQETEGKPQIENKIEIITEDPNLHQK